MARPAMSMGRALLLAALLGPAGASAVEFGTLFTTPEERARLDRLRRGEPAAATTLSEHPVIPPELTGYVKRSDGRNTVWLDGVPVPTRNPKSEQLLDPRKVRDDAARLPEKSVRSTSPPPPPAD